MKLQRTTLILIFLALGLGGFVYIYEIQGSSQREEQKAQQQQLFQFAADDIQRVTITKPNLTIRLERNSNNTDNPKWLLKSPVEAPASNASVSYLIDLLSQGKSDRTFSANQSQLPEYGLDQPNTTIEVELKNQNRHQISLGQPNFNNTALYAKTDTPAKNANQQVTIQLVSKDFENAVNRQIDEWKQPPEPLPSLTFSPTPN